MKLEKVDTIADALKQQEHTQRLVKEYVYGILLVEDGEVIASMIPLVGESETTGLTGRSYLIGSRLRLSSTFAFMPFAACGVSASGRLRTHLSAPW